LCDGDKLATTGLASITRYGGPILYLIGQSFFYFGILMWRQSGALFRPAMSTIGAAAKGGEGSARVRQDVVDEVERVAGSGDALQVMRVTKSFGGRVVVDDISFGAQEGTTLALLGPNGAGKTTAFNMIRKSTMYSFHSHDLIVVRWRYRTDNRSDPDPGQVRHLAASSGTARPWCMPSSDFVFLRV
jgi:hypothetical protein